ncbi:hypothetical protein B0H13DRAFT_1922611 [Mycena leptocephala]|nr:hypothetical protein B0H13DRAFT_1922611 [Mycena leptocephala]
MSFPTSGRFSRQSNSVDETHNRSRWSSWSKDESIDISKMAKVTLPELRRTHTRLDGTRIPDFFEFQPSSTNSDVEEYPPGSSVTTRSASVVEFRNHEGTESSNPSIASLPNPRLWLLGRRRERFVMRTPNRPIGQDVQPQPMISLREALNASIVPRFLRMPHPDECESDPMFFSLPITWTRRFHYAFPSSVKRHSLSDATFPALANSEVERVEVKAFREKDQNQFHFAIVSVPWQPFQKGTKLLVQGVLFGTFVVTGIAKFLGEWAYLECTNEELGMDVILRAMDDHVLVDGPQKIMVIQDALKKFNALTTYSGASDDADGEEV